MKLDNNGWHDKPGIPKNPERFGAHWLQIESVSYHIDWDDVDQAWCLPNGDPAFVAGRMTYLGPCLTPEEVAECDQLTNEVKFLLDRISEWEPEGLTDENARDWMGHVQPSLERLRMLVVLTEKN